jgi:hypothetical protein
MLLLHNSNNLQRVFKINKGKGAATHQKKEEKVIEERLEAENVEEITHEEPQQEDTSKPHGLESMIENDRKRKVAYIT